MRAVPTAAKGCQSMAWPEPDERQGIAVRLRVANGKGGLVALDERGVVRLRFRPEVPAVIAGRRRRGNLRGRGRTGRVRGGMRPTTVAAGHDQCAQHGEKRARHATSIRTGQSPAPGGLADRDADLGFVPFDPNEPNPASSSTSRCRLYRGETDSPTATARRFETSGLTRSIEGIGRRNAVELDAGVSAARWDFA